MWTPAFAHAACTRLEQSQLLGPLEPNTYGLPSCARAKATAMACCTPVGGRNPEGMPAPPSPGSPSPASQVAAGAGVPEVAGLAAVWLTDGDAADVGEGRADGAAGTVGG